MNSNDSQWGSFAFYKVDNSVPRSNGLERNANIENIDKINTGIILQKIDELSNAVFDLQKEIKKNTVLISVMYANNEIGTIQPIREIAKEIRHWKKGRKNFLETWERDGASTRNFSAEKYPCLRIVLFLLFL
jgi:hypothetical protein